MRKSRYVLTLEERRYDLRFVCDPVLPFYFTEDAGGFPEPIPIFKSSEKSSIFLKNYGENIPKNVLI